MNKPTKTTQLPTFDTVEQLMADTFLLNLIAEYIADFTEKRNEVSEGGKKKLKRNPIDFLIEMNKFNEKSITAEYIEIHYKRSALSGSVREFISYLVIECIGKTFQHYEVLFQKQNKNTSKSKKNGKE